jgi:hypothetical protein
MKHITLQATCHQNSVFTHINCHVTKHDTAATLTDNFATPSQTATMSEAWKSSHFVPGRTGSPVTGHTPHSSPTSHPLHPSSRPSSHPVTPSKTKASKGRKQARWRDIGDLDKLQASIESAGRLRGLTWSLNLGIGREGTLLNSKDPARLFSTYVSRELRRAIGHDLPYSFTFELVRGEDGFDRLHAHGVIVVGDANPDHVRQALIRAGGVIEDRAWAAKQLVLKPVEDAAGWTSYITKMRRWGKAVPNGRHVFISRPLKQIAHNDYDEHGLSKKLFFTKPRNARKKCVNTYLQPRETKNKLLGTCFFTGQMPGDESPFTRTPTNQEDFMHIETYMNDERYRLAVKAITVSLNRAHRRGDDPADANMNAAVALGANLPAAVASLRIDVGVVEFGDYGDLAQALADLKPQAYEAIDECQVKTVLGEIGNVWPESVRPTPQEAAQAELDAARKFIRQTSEGLSRLVYGRGINVARDFLNGVRADLDRQLQAAADAAPAHLKSGT